MGGGCFPSSKLCVSHVPCPLTRLLCLCCHLCWCLQTIFGQMVQDKIVDSAVFAFYLPSTSGAVGEVSLARVSHLAPRGVPLPRP